MPLSAHVRSIAFRLVILIGMGCSTLLAQNLAPLSVSPSKATLLVGGTQSFRAVGTDGRIRHSVHWSISPEYAVTIALQGDEVTVTAKEAAPSVVLTAKADGDSAQATIEIRAGRTLDAGTILWSVTPLPGCKSVDMKQAVPSADGPDIYDQEQCPDGTYFRALTADGREIWRRKIGGPNEKMPSGAVPIGGGSHIGFIPGGGISKAPTRPTEPASGHIHSHAASVCDAISEGMTRDDASKVVSNHHAALDARQRPSDTWTIEEEGFLCTISFDAKTGAVVKKKKTVVTD
jgi:hypothetical protein